MSEIDFEAEGLAAGLDGPAKEARLRLLDALADDGFELETLAQAVAENRLALLPVERVLGGGAAPTMTSTEIAEQAGLPLEFLDRQWRALGMALAEPDQAAFSEIDLEAAKRIAALREGGLPDEGILEVSRLLGMTMSQLAAANRRLIADALLRDGDSEYDVAVRFAEAAREFSPLIAESLGYVLNVHLREQIRHDAWGGSELAGGRAASSQEATVCFADMVEFTRLGESLEPDALGSITGRLGEIAAAVVEPPVRLVKMIGDAAMIVGPEPGPVVEAALNLLDGAEAEGEDFPILRAGVAMGEALPRAGDWYGRPVNLASRITARARPGSVLADDAVHESLADDYQWSFAGAKRLKGIDGEVRLYRCRREGAGDRE
jgi:adenylate cyclase